MINIDYFSFVIVLIISIILNYILFKFKVFHQRAYKLQIQDIHPGNPSRFGGFVIFLLFLGYQFLYSNISIYLFGSLIILIIPTLLEDFRISINPFARLIIVFICSLLVIINLPDLPQFEFGIFKILFNNQIFQITFFTLAMATVINGQNIIDGTNGLSAFSSLSIFSSILFLGIYLNDQNLINISLLIITLLIGFLIFNYPFGLIFLGDTGSYFLGFLSSYLVVDLFAKYPEIPSWSAVIILFYPTLEVIFSYFRKIAQKKSPFLPDNQHLHVKIYFLISKDKKNKTLYNSLVAPFLGIIWLSPLILLPFSIQFPHWSLIILVILIIVYLFFYLTIPNPKNNS